MALRLEDRDLVLAYQAGDDTAFAELVREYRPQLLGHARRRLGCPEAAEDAVQEALVRALRAMPRFNGNYLVGPWLHRILSNVCSDEGNRRRREGDKVERYASSDRALKPSPTTEGALGLDAGDAELLDAVGNLSEQYRQALMLRFVEELSYEEVAEVAGVSPENARARVSRARNAVRAALKLAAAAPLALVGLLRRGERAASALAASTPGSGRSAVQSALPLLAETAPTATRAAVAAANAATTGVPVVAKAAVGLGLATAVITPTVDSPVHKAAERVLPPAVMEVLSPLAVDVPAPDAPVTVADAAADVDAVDSSILDADVAAAAAAAQAEPSSQAASDAAAAEAAATDDGTGGATQAGASSSDVDAGAADAAESAAGPASDAAAAPAAVVTVMATSSVDGAELTFTPSGADRYDVAGTLSVAVTTTTTTSTEGVTSDETVTDQRSVAVVSPSTASLAGADPEVDERRFSALLVFAAPGDGASAEMRLAALGTANEDGSLSMSGVFSASPTDDLPIAERGSLAGTLRLDADGSPQSLSVTLTP